MHHLNCNENMFINTSAFSQKFTHMYACACIRACIHPYSGSYNPYSDLTLESLKSPLKFHTFPKKVCL